MVEVDILGYFYYRLEFILVVRHLVLLRIVLVLLVLGLFEVIDLEERGACRT